MFLDGGCLPTCNILIDIYEQCLVYIVYHDILLVVEYSRLK